MVVCARACRSGEGCMIYIKEKAEEDWSMEQPRNVGLEISQGRAGQLGGSGQRMEAVAIPRRGENNYC